VIRASVAISALAPWLLVMLTAPAFGTDEVTVYRWVDEDGVPHYTDRPEDAPGNVQRTEIRSQRTDPAQLQARVEARRDLEAARETRRDQQEEAADEARQRREETREQRAANCERARQQLETYETARRLYRPLPGGEREYLDDEEMDSARASARQAVREWCD